MILCPVVSRCVRCGRFKRDRYSSLCSSCGE